MHELKKKIPPYTLPFILVTWIMIGLFHYLHLEPLIAHSLPKGNLVHIWRAVDLGFSQVMFQENLLVGIFFFTAILVSSPLAAAYAFYGSLLGSLLEILIPSTISMINVGLFGYNAVLCGIALGGKTRRSFVMATIAILLSDAINFSFDKLGLVSLTFPFVVATWIVVLLFFLSKKIRA
jgi:urea transporter